MQRSLLRIAMRLAALVMLAAGVLQGAPARAAQPITVTASALRHIASDPYGLTFETVTSVKPGDMFMYVFDLQPKNDPTTPMNLIATFDTARLDVTALGGNGACVGVFDTKPLVCRDQFAGTDYPHMSIIWVWFTVKGSFDSSPLKMTVTAGNDTKTISVPYAASTRKMYLPVFRR